MDKQELKEKIIKIILKTKWSIMFGDCFSISEPEAKAIADALVSEGMVFGEDESGNKKLLQNQQNYNQIENYLKKNLCNIIDEYFNEIMNKLEYYRESELFDSFSIRLIVNEIRTNLKTKYNL